MWGIQGGSGSTAAKEICALYAQSMIEGFFSSYYLDALIDWETGECHFEDARFRTLLEWLRNHVGAGAEWIKGYIPDNVLLEERI